MKKVWNFLLKNKVIVGILLVGLIARIYEPISLYSYGHDQDLAGWIIKDILINGHLRLIGQQTSSLGIFIGPLFYYLQIPFYLLTKLDPVGTLMLTSILGLFTVFSFYFVFSKVFDERTGLIAAFIYALSGVIVFTDREAVPTMPVVLWTVWYFYSLWLSIKGNKKAYILAGFLFGLVWHLNLALAILSPLIVLAHYFSHKKIYWREVFLGMAAFFLLMSPFIAFEVRHDFRQVRAIYESFTTQKDYIPGTGRGLSKFDRVLQLTHVNTRNLYWGGKAEIRIDLMFYLLVVLFILLVAKRVISKRVGMIMVLWVILYLAFFTFNSINVSEYYLNGMNIIWIAIGALAVSRLMKEKRAEYLALAILAVFAYMNVTEFISKRSNGSGYKERKAIVSYINEDARKHDYPCVSVSYIASPGNDLGYRYLFWLKGMHVNQSASGSPVYSIVFPLSMVSGVDKTFGALGLVLPDYGRYTKSGVEVSCSGANSNLTDPMFGYTE